jgi:argininosuccinate lyase
MGKLWEKGYRLDAEVERFTVGKDYMLDQELVEADCLGSIAHASMLSGIGILSKREFARLNKVLVEIILLQSQGKFKIKLADEDVHTAVENFLTRKLGDLGKKIHIGRSRNDQVLLDLRIYARQRLLDMEEAVLALAGVLVDFARKHSKVPMVGRTHTQPAMPSTVGLWAASFAESLLDDLELLKTAYDLNNQSPLGAAAGFGTSLPIDRGLTARLLGFRKVQNNVLYAVTSRPKIEAIILFALSQVMDDLARLASDLIFYSVPEMRYFTLPEEYCPGSSIMPQKRNPAPLELIRAKAAAVAASLSQVTSTARLLPSGYNRDFQETKEPLFRSFETTEASLRISGLIFTKLKVNEKALLAGFTPQVFAADQAADLAKEGVPFRKAYKEVAKKLNKLEGRDPLKNILQKKHQGAPGNLGLSRTANKAQRELRRVKKERSRLDAVRRALLAL